MRTFGRPYIAVLIRDLRFLDLSVRHAWVTASPTQMPFFNKGKSSWHMRLLCAKEAPHWFSTIVFIPARLRIAAVAEGPSSSSAPLLFWLSAFDCRLLAASLRARSRRIAMGQRDRSSPATNSGARYASMRPRP